MVSSANWKCFENTYPRMVKTRNSIGLEESPDIFLSLDNENQRNSRRNLGNFNDVCDKLNWLSLWIPIFLVWAMIVVSFSPHVILSLFFQFSICNLYLALVAELFIVNIPCKRVQTTVNFILFKLAPPSFGWLPQQSWCYANNLFSQLGPILISACNMLVAMASMFKYMTYK